MGSSSSQAPGNLETRCRHRRHHHFEFPGEMRPEAKHQQCRTIDPCMIMMHAEPVALVMDNLEKAGSHAHVISSGASFGGEGSGVSGSSHKSHIKETLKSSWAHRIYCFAT